jgi:hypothetical protein
LKISNKSNEQWAAEPAERKRAEEQLRCRERKLSDFLEKASVGLHWTQANGNTI